MCPSIPCATIVIPVLFIDFCCMPTRTMADFLVPSTASPETDAQHRLNGPIHAKRHVRVICIGAGASGLLMAYKLQRHFDNFSLTVYEKNSEVSGTWWENKYPG